MKFIVNIVINLTAIVKFIFCVALIIFIADVLFRTATMGQYGLIDIIALMELEYEKLVKRLKKK